MILVVYLTLNLLRKLYKTMKQHEFDHLNQNKINGETNQDTLYLFWQPTKEGVRLMKVYGQNPCLVLPETVEGRPITEIGAYCFSQSERDISGDYFISEILSGAVSGSITSIPRKPTEQRICPEFFPLGTVQRISGRFVESITLPSTVTTLHNAAFYNCRNLHTLSVGSEIRAIGSDEFTNCSRLTELILRCEDSQKTGLSLILERIETDLNVYFTSGSRITGALFFPEYYEWLDEISPAHIFSRSIHGEGFRMRKCFQNQIVDYKKYDQCFENALAVESEKSLCQIAMNRLRWPKDLTADLEAVYENILKKHLTIAISKAVQKRDMELLLFLCRRLSFGTAEFTQAITACTEADWASGVASLMEEKHRLGSFADKSFDFDEF